MKIKDILTEISGSDLTRSRPNTPPPGTKIATPKVAAGTGADGPAGKYARPKVKPGTGKYGPASRYDTVDLKGTSGDGWEIDDDGELTIAITEPKGPPEEEAYADPSVMRDAVKIGKPERARGARGQNMTRADDVASAAAKFKKPVDPKYPYTAPDGRRLKYPHGDLRKLFEPSPDTRKAGSDVVVRDSNKKKKPNSRMSDDDRK